jgi:hypothetical protein
MNIRAVLTALFVASAVALSPGGLSAQDAGGAGAETDTTSPVTESHRSHRLIPSVGIPFASGSFLGTIDIQNFAAQGNRIVANTLVRIGQRTTSARLPVRIVRATCSVLELEVGPPPGAQRPLGITQTIGTSELRQQQFCTIANAEGTQARVAALNERGQLGASLGACPWYQTAGCAVAVVACGASCALGPEVCIPCLAGVGASSCLDCFFNN